MASFLQFAATLEAAAHKLNAPEVVHSRCKSKGTTTASAAALGGPRRDFSALRTLGGSNQFKTAMGILGKRNARLRKRVCMTFIRAATLTIQYEKSILSPLTIFCRGSARVPKCAESIVRNVGSSWAPLGPDHFDLVFVP